MSTAFVTGGSGFLVREIVRALVARGWRVRGLARSDAAAKAVADAGGEPVRGDLDDARALEEGMRGCELVYHSAALVTTTGRKADFLRVNVEGTRRVLEAARAAKVRRAVHVSTEAVLVGKGEPPIIAADETRPRPRRPLGLYPLSKGMAEEVVEAQNRDGLETVIIRPRFIWGKGDTTLLPQIAAMVKKGRFAWIGGGRFKTSTCHVQNCALGAILAAEQGKPGQIYFLTDGEPVEMRGFLSRLMETQGVTVPQKEVPRWLARAAAAVSEPLFGIFGKRPPVDRTGVRLIGEEVTVNDAKARRELGYTPMMTIDAGIAEMAA